MMLMRTNQGRKAVCAQLVAQTRFRPVLVPDHRMPRDRDAITLAAAVSALRVRLA
jgi:hypothetical protein